MSLKEMTRVVRRLEFVKLVLKAQGSLSQLCRRFGISRPTGYKWKRRFEEGGSSGLGERGRRPHHSPRQTPPEWLKRMARLRRRRRSWGSRKLWARLRKDYPGQRVPGARTIGKWLKRLGLSGHRSRRTRRGPPLERPKLTRARRSNHVWTVDFKGWFRTGDGQRVEPLTVRDLFSRYLLDIVLLADQRWEPVREVFARLFGKYGYPRVVRVDNGGPFGSKGPAGLSRLSAWWTALGIRVEFIAPGHPEQNGGHEQMHRVMKAETTRPASSCRRAQQRRTGRWVRTFNVIRPHEALGQRVPAEVYRARPGPVRQVALSYANGWAVRRVRSNGQIRWQGRKRFVGEAFVGYTVGLKPLSQERWKVYFAKVRIGELWASDTGGMRPANYARGC